MGHTLKMSCFPVLGPAFVTTENQKSKLISVALCVSVRDHTADDKTFLSEICSGGEAIILFVGMSKEIT